VEGEAKAPLDRWADWLLRGRQRGLSEAQAKRLASSLHRLRNRTMRDARIRAGQRVLDVGAGTGLLTLEALRRVGSEGLVLALDISHDALRECQHQSRAEQPAGFVHTVRGDAICLPVAGGAFDAVLARSVLIYVADKAGAIRELYRVLRPGGRAAIFEPINQVADFTRRSQILDISSIQPAHDEIRAYIRGRSDHNDTMLGFDERDLVQWFVDAGFIEVELFYRHSYSRRPRRLGEITNSIRQRPNPSMLSYEEGARAVRGDAADEHLRRYVKLLRDQPSLTASAGAFVTARR